MIWKKIIAIIMTVFIGINVSGCGFTKGFDAQGYIQAILDLNFQGDVALATQFFEKETSKELTKHYNACVQQFVLDHLTGDIEMNNDLLDKYIELTKELFSAIRYSVKDTKKISSTEYEVTVTYQTMDVLPNFIKSLQKDSAELEEKAANGGYPGTQEEVSVQMMDEFRNDAYELYESAYLKLNYGAKEEQVIKIKGSSIKGFSIPKDTVEKLLIKILDLDSIQG
ncbi:MAG: hypothetical protein RR799_05090 [Lachnospiraceae bacterium]